MTYYTVYDVFVSDLGLRSTELHVYAAIYSAVVHMKGYISITQITKQTGVARTTVCRIVKSLEERGMITRTPHGRRRKNQYKLQSLVVDAKGFPMIPSSQPECTSVKSTHSEEMMGQNYNYVRTRTSSKPLLPY